MYLIQSCKSNQSPRLTGSWLQVRIDDTPTDSSEVITFRSDKTILTETIIDGIKRIDSINYYVSRDKMSFITYPFNDTLIWEIVDLNDSMLVLKNNGILDYYSRVR